MIKMNEMKPEREKLSARAKELRRRIKNEHCGYSVQSTVTVSACLSVPMRCSRWWWMQH